jgi:hypothetical protein
MNLELTCDVNNLEKARKAAILLRQLGLISVADIRRIMDEIHQGCNDVAARDPGDAVIYLIDPVWRDTRPL